MAAHLKVIGEAPRKYRVDVEEHDSALPYALEAQLAELAERADLALYDTQRDALLRLCGTRGVQRVEALRVEVVTDSVQLTVRVLRDGQPHIVLIGPSGRPHLAG